MAALTQVEAEKAVIRGVIIEGEAVAITSQELIPTV